MLRVVREERAGLLREFPDSLRVRAETLQVVCERRPSASHLREGIEPGTLGLFEGDCLLDEPADASMPTRIVLFLDNLKAEAGGRPGRFREEVRITLLHEIGHLLGFGESDLEDRDLG